MTNPVDDTPLDPFDFEAIPGAQRLNEPRTRSFVPGQRQPRFGTPTRRTLCPECRKGQPCPLGGTSFACPPRPRHGAWTFSSDPAVDEGPATK